jgi:hypothetical protein
MTALIVIAVAGIAIFVLVPLFRQQRGPQDQSSSTTASDDPSSSWSGLATPVALGLAADDSDHSPPSDRDQGDRADESGWGEHGASGSWGEHGGTSSDSDSGGGDSDGGGDGGSNND